MTLKHIKFDESQTMRSFEKVAIKKGLVKQEEMVKQASASLTPTEDLDSDLISLATGLRQRGFMKEADVLEDKFYALKLAETHLYRAIDEDGQDLLDFAHPDGDARVADSPYGAVETLDSAHKKIVDTISKTPTGKLASPIRDFIVAIADVLEVVPLKKQGQLSETQRSELGGDSEKKTKAKIINETINKLWASKGQLHIAKAKSYLTGSADSPVSLSFDPWKVLSGTGAIYYLSKLGAKNTTETDFKNLYSAWTQLFGEKSEASSEAVADKISSLAAGGKGANTLFSYFAGIDKLLKTNFANTYFKGAVFTQYEYDADEESRAQKASSDIRYNASGPNGNPKSIWTINFDWITSDEISMDGGNLSAAATAIYNALVNAFNNYVGEAQIDKANKAAQKELQEVMSPVLSLLDMGITPVRNTNAFALFELEGLKGQLTDASEHFVKKGWKILSALDATDVAEAINLELDEASKSLDELKKFLETNQLDPILDVPADPTQLVAIASHFRSIALGWNQYIELNPKMNESDLAAVNNNLSMAVAAYKVLTAPEVEKKPYGVLRAELPAALQKGASSPAALAQFAAKGYEIIQNLLPTEIAGDKLQSPDGNITGSTGDIKVYRNEAPTTASATQNEFIKEGQWAQVGKGSGKPAGSGGKPASGAGGSLSKFDPKSPDQIAVANMQLALNNFGRFISAEGMKAKFPKMTDYDASDGLKIIGTGPKSNPHLNMFDGKWGPNTDAALNLAQKYLSNFGLNLNVGVKWNGASRSHAEGTATAANSNTNVLNRANSFLSGQVSAPVDAVLDTLPNNINWSPDAVGLLAYDTGSIKLMKSDLGSLASLYNFLTKNGLRSPETTGLTIESSGVEGFSYRTWNEVLNWFPARARFLFDAARAANNTDSATKAREYYAAAKKLWEDANRFFNFVYKNNKNVNQDEVVDWNLLNKFSKPTVSVAGLAAESGGQPGAGSAYSLKNKQLPGLRGGPGAEGVKNPRFQGMEEDLAIPFSDYIDFRHARWSGFDASALNAPYIKLRDMLRVPGKRMAQAMFAGSRASQENLELSAAKKLGKEPVGYDPELGALAQKGGQLVPIFNQKQRSQIALGGAPLNQYQRFLNDLGENLHSIMKEWVADTEASVDEIDNLQQFYNQWQRAIGKQLQDLKR